MYLKWKDSTVGVFDKQYNLTIVNNKLEPVRINFTTHIVKRHYVENFFKERIPSKERGDLNEILNNLNLENYDVLNIAKATRGFNLMDNFWISFSKDESYFVALNKVFQDIDNKKSKVNLISPRGRNPKYYTILGKDLVGVTKRRLKQNTNDLEMDIVVHRLGKLLGIRCCPMWMIGEDKAFCQFNYDIRHEYITHVSRYMEQYHRTRNLYLDLINVLPEYQGDIEKMIVLDFVTRQEGRSLSNCAIKCNREFYPLYDNGMALFYDKGEHYVSKCISDIEKYCTVFGKEGTYLDYIKQIKDLKSLNLNLQLKREQILGCFDGLNTPTYRKLGAVSWIEGCLNILNDIMYEKRGNHER